MDLNNIELPVPLVVDLYRDFLVGTDEKKEKILPENTGEKEKPASLVKTTSSDTWKSLGNNQKNILIVVDHKDVVHLPDDELSFLTGILNACKLSLGDVAIINRNNYKEITYKELIAYFKSKNVFLFGIDPVTFGLPMDFPHYQLQAFQKISFLYSPSLVELENDKLLKSKLWVCLKRIFNI